MTGKPLPYQYRLIDPTGREFIISGKAPIDPKMVGYMVEVVLTNAQSN